MVMEKIAPVARMALRENTIAALHNLEVAERDEVLVLYGRVASYYHKQLAQGAVRSVARGWEIVNNISVTKKVCLA